MQTTNLKQQQLTFDKGITNVPSDAICSDNTLEESIGLVYENGEHRVIQRPRLIMKTNLSSKKLLYVHNYNNVKRYIFAYTYEDDTHNEKTVYSYGIQVGTAYAELGILGRTSGRIDNFFYKEGSRITSIGKTLIITDSDGIHYFLWKENTYDGPYADIPEQQVQFALFNDNVSENTVEEQGLCQGWLEDMSFYYKVNPLYQTEWNNLVVGQYAKMKKRLHQKKRFWGSFAVRTALKMYDGSYHHISNPIIIFNKFNVHRTGDIISGITLKQNMYGQELKYKMTESLASWKDLISEVVIFISRETEPLDTQSDAKLEKRDSSSPFTMYLTGSPSRKAQGDPVNDYDLLDSIEEDATKELIENGVFYRLCSIPLGGTNDSWQSVDSAITAHTLENIETQEQLKEDDYYGHTSLSPEFIYAYNSRLNLANVSRTFFPGFNYFLPYDSNNSSTYTIYVRINAFDVIRTVKLQFSTIQKQGIWFYYPDSRATHVTILKNGTCILDEQLKEHPTLNGAYYFKGMLTESGDDEPSGATATIIDDDVNTTPELLPNYIIQSEVNNPFVFKAEGYHKVSTGKILAMSSTTMALSQDQFGKTDLLVFSDAGLWGLQVDRTGTYDSIHPITRDVLTHANTVTQTDGAVFFATKKGLMVVSENGVGCVSEQLNTMPKFLDSDRVRIAYDYRDSLLWLFNPGVPERAFVYGMKSRTFASFDTTNMPIEGVVGDYPDNLLQASNASNGTIYSLIQRDDIHDDDGDYSATLITRPMKLENAFALKRLIQVLHVRQFDEAKLSLRIFASNNLRPETSTWVELHSLRGTPWKYYRFRYDFTSLKATDRFAGTVLVTREERTDKLR